MYSKVKGFSCRLDEIGEETLINSKVEDSRNSALPQKYTFRGIQTSLLFPNA